MNLHKIKVLCVALAVASMGVVVGSQPAQAASLPKIKASQTKLYNATSNQSFTPRGANFVRLAPIDYYAYHSTFEPERYNHAAAVAFLSQMQHDKYNTVRIFIDPGIPDPEKAHGIGRGMGTYDTVYGPYIDNVASFITAAAEHNIYVIPVLDAFPQNSYYWGIVARYVAGVGTPNMAGNNLSYMEKGRVMAKAAYMQHFVEELLVRIGQEHKNAILAYQSDNEAFFETNAAPFDKLTGTVTPLNGVTYDMSKPADRQQAADASLVIYTQLLKQGLQKADPEALLTMGFFTHQAVGKSKFNGLTSTYCSANCKTEENYYRVPGRPAAVSIYGSIDFIDLHLYPKTYPYDAAPELHGMEQAYFAKPYIIGEMGAYKAAYGNDVRTAAYAMRDMRIKTCKYNNAQGWLMWTWDTYENLAGQDTVFKLNESGGAINGQMAPTAQPNPCSNLYQPPIIVPTPIPVPRPR